MTEILLENQLTAYLAFSFGHFAYHIVLVFLTQYIAYNLSFNFWRDLVVGQSIGYP